MEVEAFLDAMEARRDARRAGWADLALEQDHQHSLTSFALLQQRAFVSCFIGAELIAFSAAAILCW
jgi:hypothetical protein